jgi:hypothetical protein
MSEASAEFPQKPKIQEYPVKEVCPPKPPQERT